MQRQITVICHSLCSSIVDGDVVCQSQHGEELFAWSQLGFKSQGVFVEIGAHDGISLSNSQFFEGIGWKCLLVEANPGLVGKCRQNRPDAIVVHAAVGADDGGTIPFSQVTGPNGMEMLSHTVTSAGHLKRIAAKGGRIDVLQVPRRSLQAILNEHHCGTPDILSIDVEGAELDVLKGVDFEHCRPKVIVVEDNTAGRDSAVASFLGTVRYRRVITVGCNDIFVADGHGH